MTPRMSGWSSTTRIRATVASAARGRSTPLSPASAASGGRKPVPLIEGDRLDLGVHTELGQDVLHMALDGEGADAELLSDLRRGLPRREGSQDLALARGEPTEQAFALRGPAVPQLLE